MSLLGSPNEIPEVEVEENVEEELLDPEQEESTNNTNMMKWLGISGAIILVLIIIYTMVKKKSNLE